MSGDWSIVWSYTRNTPFEGRTLTPDEIVIAFVLYADTLLSIHQIAQLFEAVYDTIHTTIREVKAVFEWSPMETLLAKHLWKRCWLNKPPLATK